MTWRCLIVPISAGFLVACGVPVEEHQSTLDALAKVKAESAAQKREAEAARITADQRTAGLAAEIAALKLSVESCQGQLAKATTPPVPPPPPPAVDATVGPKSYVIGGEKVTAAKLGDTLKKAHDAQPTATLRIKSEPAARYSAVIKLIDLAKEAGFKHIHVATE